jgi:hypothetical protein
MSPTTSAALRLSIPLILTLPVFAGSTPSSVTLTSSKNPATYGKSVTLTASLTPTAATGTVTFYSGTTVLETEPIANGKAKLSTILLPFGAQPLKAYYGGDGTYAPSTSAVLTHTVNTVPGYGFGAALISPTNLGPNSGALGDFNGDGKEDFAFSDNSDSVGVLLGNGDGTFQAVAVYPLPSGSIAQSVAVGDFNGDGIPDLVVGNALSDSMSLLLGNGDGSFQPAVNFDVGILNVAVSIAVADFNGDGKADLAVADSQTETVSVLLGDGNGNFQPPVNYAVGSFPLSVAVGDFNNDGKADLAVSNSNGYDVSILLGNGDGTFQQAVGFPVVGYDSTSVVVEDFNQDGNLDVAISNQDGVSVLLGNGDGTFQPAAIFGAPGDPSWAASGDFNGDGKADIALANNVGTGVLLGNGDGTFQTEVIYLPEVSSVAVGDFNEDGRADIAGLGAGATILLGAPAVVSSTALLSSLNPSTYGQKLTLTAEVSPTAATGTVSFYSGAAALGQIALNNGVAKLKIATLPGGTDSLIALYSGDSTYPRSTSLPLTQTVNRAATFTGLTSSPDPSNLGQTVTFTASVSSTTATGTVTFYHGSTALGKATVGNGFATLATTALPTGSHSITAVYSGDGNYAGSNSPAWVQIVKATTTITLTSSPNPSNLNQTVTLTAAVSPSTATGTVTFYHGTTSMGTAALSNGIATLGVSTLTAGQHSLTAAYGGDSGDAPSTSPAITQTVN